jgi:hypothetical protein
VTHMVIFRSPDGKPDYHQADSLEEATAFAEKLRNEERVTDARIFRMEEVPIEFKAYYKIEVVAATPPAADYLEVVPREADGDAGDVAEAAGKPGRLGLFSRGS